MTFKEKRKDLLKMNDRDFIDRILAFPDRERLNRDENGKRRQYPSAEMAVRARQSMEKNPEWKLSDKQKFAMADSFAKYSSNELKVAGIKFANIDPNTLVKDEVSKEGIKTVYNMEFHLKPEPENVHDKNAVAVYVDNVEGTRTRIGYVPAAYTAEHPIIQSMTVKGTLTDHSNGHFKTISYTMDMDTEFVNKTIQGNRNPDVYTYQMPFVLNGEPKEGTAEYLNKQWDWKDRINHELEYYSTNGEISNVRFEFPGGKVGNIIVESTGKLNTHAMQVCGSYFHYNLETGISSELKREGYVDVAQTVPAINTRDRTYFSLQAEPQPKPEPEVVKEVNTQPLSLEQLKTLEFAADDGQDVYVWFRKGDEPINSGLIKVAPETEDDKACIEVTISDDKPVDMSYIDYIPANDIYESREALTAANKVIEQNQDEDFAKAVTDMASEGLTMQ